MSEAPYPGLRPFKRGETDIFFGRQRYVDQLIDHLASNRFLSIVGPSGCGKSSLVRAGLLDALESGFLAESGTKWTIVEMRPGGAPTQQLAEVLLPLSKSKRYENDTVFLRASLERGRTSLVDFCQSLPLFKGDNLLILIDQFEEIFRLSQEPSEVNHFITLLLAAAKQRNFPIYIVITMRSEFISECTSYPGLPEAINEAQFLTPRLTREQSREAIEQPARIFDGDVEPALVNRLLNDMEAEADQLSLMQYALMRLWIQSNKKAQEKGEPLILTLADYEQMGGLNKALSNQTEYAFSELSSEQQRIAEILFRRLTERSPKKWVMRRPTTMKEIAEVAGVSADEVEPVVEVFCRSDRNFLTSSTKTDLKPSTVLDLSNECVTRQWQRLGNWADKETLSAENYRRIEQTALLWMKNKAALWSMPTLDTAKAWYEIEKPNLSWAKRYGLHFSEAMQFLSESQKEYESKRNSEEEKRKRQLAVIQEDVVIQSEFAEQQREVAKKLRHMAWCLGILALLAIAVGIISLSQKKIEVQRALENEIVTENAFLAREEMLKKSLAIAEEEKKVAVQMVLEAESGNRKFESTRLKDEPALFELGKEFKEQERALKTSLALAEDAMDQLKEAEDVVVQTRAAQKEMELDLEEAEKTVIRTRAAQKEMEVDLEDATTANEMARRERRRAEVARLQAETAEKEAREHLQSIMASERQRTQDLFESQLIHASVLAREEDYSAAKESLKNTRELDPKILPAHRHARDLLFGYTNIMSGEADVLYQGPGSALFGVAVSPDGRLLATCGKNGVLLLFNVDSGKLLQRLEGHVGNVYGVAFHPRGDWLASGGNDGKIILWQMPVADEPASKIREWEISKAVWPLAVNPGDSSLASGSIDKKISLWDPKVGKLISILKGHKKAVAGRGLAFNPSGTLLASASYDETVRIWDVKKAKTLQVLAVHTGKVYGVAFSPNGDSLASSGQDKRLILWHANSGKKRLEFTGHRDSVFGIDFLPGQFSEIENPLLISGSRDRTVRVWDVSTGVCLRIFQGHQSGVVGVTTSPSKGDETGPTIFSASNDGTIRRWPLSSQPGLTMIDVKESATSVALAPDGSKVVVGFESGSLRVYSLPDLQLLAEEQVAHQERINRLRFSHDGSSLASSALEEVANLWDISGDGTMTKKQTFSGHLDIIYGLDFAPDDGVLATAGYDGRVGLFTIGTENRRWIDAHEKRVAAVALHPKKRFLLSAGVDDKILRVWDTKADPPKPVKEFPPARGKILWVSISPDGKWIAMVGRERTVRVYSTDSYELVHEFAGHKKSVRRAIFSPDSLQLATVSSDATVRVWDLTTAKGLLTLQLPAPKGNGNFSPLRDFDFRSTPSGTWIVVPLTTGRLAAYNFGHVYNDPPSNQSE